MRARAPGKVLLSGEYVVLEGAPAVVLAVDRYAYAELRPRTAPSGAGDALSSNELPREARAALDEARACGLLSRAPEGSVALDVAEQNEGGRKLGLGSSAAGAVAALGAALLAETRDPRALEAPGVREAVARAARRGHRRAQGGGSGVDVLASALGGALAVTLDAHSEGEPAVEPLTLPPRLCWSVLWTGTPVRTSELLARVHALPAATRDALYAPLRAQATALLEALRRGDAEAVCEAAEAQRAGLARLGERAGAPIVTEAMESLAHALRPLGVASKPSGAGGGDVVLALATEPRALDEAARRAEALGFVALRLALDTGGVRRVD